MLLKIFLTQLTGVYKKIEQEEQESIEDAARLLAQALTANGQVYIHGFKEMEGIVSQAINGPEPLKGLKKLYSGQYMVQAQQRDRAIIFARSATEKEAVALAESLRGQHVPFVAVSQGVKPEDEGKPNLTEIADVHVDIKAVRGLPTLAAALFAYQAIIMGVDEILREYEEE